MKWLLVMMIRMMGPWGSYSWCIRVWLLMNSFSLWDLNGL